MPRIPLIKAPLCLVALLTVLLIGCSDNPSAGLILLNVPALAGSAEPHLANGPDGGVLLSWLEPTADGVALRYASYEDQAFSPAATIATGSDWFVNWADFPSVTPITDNLWAAHWLVKRPGGTYAYDVAVALSTDRGTTWHPPITPHTDNTRTEHGFVSLYKTAGGAGVLWLDGRATSGGAHTEHGHAGGGMTLRSAVVTASGELSQEQLVDDLVCDCCQTDVAVTVNGPVLVYRNRAEDEIRDIYVAQSIDGHWQAGRAIANDGWRITGCPVNGPAIAAQGSQVAVAWYTAANDQPAVHFAMSSDAGTTFSSPVTIDAEQPLGRVDVVVLGDGAAAVSWLRTGDATTGEVVVGRIQRDGELGTPLIIAETTAARPSGFPQMVRVGDSLLFAWTHITKEASELRAARLPISAL